MRQIPAIAALAFLCVIFPFVALAQEPPTWDIQALNNIIPGLKAGSITMQGDTVIGTNGVYVKYGDDGVDGGHGVVEPAVGQGRGGRPCAHRDGRPALGGRAHPYNFKTHQMQSEQFRTGQGAGVRGGQGTGRATRRNQTYHARHAFVTTDDVADPDVPRPRQPHQDRSRQIRGDVERGAVRRRRAGVLFSVLPAQHRAAREQLQFHRRFPQPLTGAYSAEHLHLVVQ